MPKPGEAPGLTLIRLWTGLSPIPGGRWIFSRILAWQVPYSGSIRAQVVSLTPGHCRVQLRERRRVRNHLKSIHAVALANLGELCSGLGLLSGLPPQVRGIVIKISTEYFKKARGTIHAESSCSTPSVNQDTEFVVTADMLDEQQDLVARTTVTWKLGLIE